MRRKREVDIGSGHPGQVVIIGRRRFVIVSVSYEREMSGATVGVTLRDEQSWKRIYRR